MSRDTAAGGNAGTLLVEVALPVPLPRNFTYIYEEGDSDGPRPEVGDLVVVPFGRRREVIGLVVAVRREPGNLTEIDGNKLRKVVRLLGPEYSLAKDRFNLAGWLAGYYALPLGEVVPLFHPPAPGTKARKSRHVTAAYPLDENSGDILPTSDQTAAIAIAADHIENRNFGALLLHGITGSGKTEVYLRAIQEALDRGRGALYLLPEIALTPQTVARISDRFSETVGTIHSGLSAGERCRVHEAAAAGDIRVVVGPRSALFAPVRDVGLIVVDEEHETSYKQDEKPRYHARHAALIRAREAGAFVILGSATPDLESYRNAREGRYIHIELSYRPIGRVPVVEIVDMRGGKYSEGFSPALTARLEETLDNGRQAILYYNRRGFARALQCGECGESVACPRCDIGLTLHLRPRRLLCHYCGFTLDVPQQCPSCAAESFLPSGGGTEKVELALAAQFPGVKLLRLDQDTTRRRGAHARLLSAFASGEASILVGTQMVAKGHHFPNVDLVGVLAADDGLTLPDFRAQERAFQLLTQVAGRTGRTQPGKVIFQTWQPEHPVIQAAAAQDYAAFAETELEVREQLGYPPFRRLMRIGISGRTLSKVTAAAAALADVLRPELAPPEFDLLGPAPAVFARLQDRYRFQLLLKGSPGVRQKRWIADCARMVHERFSGVDVLLDMDPAGLF